MKRTLDEMTGLRGAAAFLICLNHTLLLVPALYQSVLSPFLMRCGLLGMILFFCIKYAKLSIGFQKVLIYHRLCTFANQRVKIVR